APSRAKATAMARPIPVPPPVIRATFPASRVTILLFRTSNRASNRTLRIGPLSRPVRDSSTPADRPASSVTVSGALRGGTKKKMMYRTCALCGHPAGKDVLLVGWGFLQIVVLRPGQGRREGAQAGGRKCLWFCIALELKITNKT